MHTGAMSAAQTEMLRAHLVEELRSAGHVQSGAVEHAFRVVPRHLFVPQAEPTDAYRDQALPTKFDQNGRAISSSSQPAIMAVMLEQLAVAPGQRVLEIGAGTGYNAALLGELVGPTGSVITVDIDEDLVAGARAHLAASGATRVEVVQGDGALGWPERAPYDRIILTVGASDIAPAWTEQLAPSGRLVLPLSLGGVQQSVAFESRGEHLESLSVRGCGFMPLRGALAESRIVVALDDQAGLHLELPEPRDVDATSLASALRQPGEQVASGVVVSPEDLWGGLGLWLALGAPGVGRLTAMGEAAQGLVPSLIAAPGVTMTIALVGVDSLAVLVRLNDDQSGVFEVGARALGPDASRLAKQLVERVRAWQEDGRRSAAELRVAAYPRADEGIPTAPKVIDKPHRRLVMSWLPRAHLTPDATAG